MANRVETEVMELVKPFAVEFGLELVKVYVPMELEDDIPAELIEKLNARAQARKEKNWALSDQLRDEINAAGYDIKDSPEGSKLVKR